METKSESIVNKMHRNILHKFIQKAEQKKI